MDGAGLGGEGGARSPRGDSERRRGRRGDRLLLLFDIDGTLLGGATDAHRDALDAALREVHGVDAAGARAAISPAGRTDGEIARVILLDAGVSALRIDERAQDVRDVCCREYARLCPPSLAHAILRGVPELLEWLAGVGSAEVGLLTGNYEPIARLKLKRAGIGGCFPPGRGAFGSDDEDRAALPAIARRRAGSGGAPHPYGRTIVIGDTPRDIACARADGARCFAVATGPFDRAALKDADGVAADAVELMDQLRNEVRG